MAFADQFPDFPPEEFPALPDGFTDTSWRNDACPCVESEGFTIWIDRADQQQRELPSQRFTVVVADDPFAAVAFEADDWSAVLNFIDRGSRMDRDEALLRFIAVTLSRDGLVHLGVDAVRDGLTWLIVSETNQPIATVHEDGRVELTHPTSIDVRQRILSEV